MFVFTFGAGFRQRDWPLLGAAAHGDEKRGTLDTGWGVSGLYFYFFFFLLLSWATATSTCMALKLARAEWAAETGGRGILGAGDRIEQDP